MSTTQFENPYDCPSLAKRIAMPILYGMYKVLPTRLYEAFYRPAFALYRWALRSAYRRGLNQDRRRGDVAAVVRKERVYSVMEYSLVGAPGLEHTHNLAAKAIAEGVSGAFVECGVAQGGCAALLAQVAASERGPRHCWFFDSYEGLPDPTGADYDSGKTGRHIRPLPKGSCVGTYEQVSQLLFEHFGLAREHVTLVKGWFQDTLPVTKTKIGPIAILRVDGDWYESTKCCLEELFPHVSSGGQVIIDDYYSCYGASKATDEFVARHRIETQLTPDGRGGVSFPKPPLAVARVA